MSLESEAWDRFFRGSKYEAKWLKLGQRAPDAVIDGGEEYASWLGRLKDERASDPPRAIGRNPFDRPPQREVA